VYSYKQSRRREDDLAIVNAGLRVVIEELNGNKCQWRIGDCTLVYGGMSKTTVMAPNTQQALIGREWNEATLQEATRLLSEELQLSRDAPGGMPEYRKSLVTSFFFKFYLTVSCLLSPLSLPQHLHSATHKYHRLVPLALFLSHRVATE
jgi:xanthine dehydrogenase/oxidase